MRRGIEQYEPTPELNALAGQVIGAAIEVHKAIGPGYLESVYEEAICRELTIRRIPFSRQHVFTLTYKDVAVGQGRLDLFVSDCLIVELKAIEMFMPIHKAQLLSYLKAMHCHLGLLINFNVPMLTNGVRRVILS